MSENTTAAQSVSSINDVLLEALTESGISAYSAGSALAKAEELLKEREYTIAENIISDAENRFGYGLQATEVVEAAGLGTRPAPAVEEVEESDDEAAPAADGDKLDVILSTLQKQGETIEKLVNAAARNGITL